MINARDIQIRLTHYHGYGGPEGWTVRAVHRPKNLLLDSADAGSEREAGKIEGRFEAAWKRDWSDDEFAAATAGKPLASTVCSHCGLDTLDGVSSVGMPGSDDPDTGEREFCKRAPCQQELKAHQRRIIDAEKAFRERLANQQADRDEQLAADATEAQTGFHWRDNWYFKRMADGTVRVSHVSGKYVTPQLFIPADEWASIVASVSAEGETGDRWQRARDFHSGGVVA